MIWCKQITMATIGLSIIAIGMSAYSLMHPSKSLESFDVKGTVKQFQKQLVEDHLSKYQAQRQFSKFSKALELSEKSYATSHHVQLIVSQASVAGIKDATPQIQQGIAKNMV
jgi:type-F conjugative transfer system protein TrbI